ncbi:MAG: prolipoprotein diacylglyceryl transferase [bacterium]|nr:prolipoprotein diacylglyceryl transferase [bacterium]
MLPVLLDLKVIKIYTFGVFLVLSLFWGAFLLWRNVRLTQYKEEDIFDSMIVSLIGGMFVGRLVYVLLNWSSFGFDILKFILINGYPGFSFYGCIAGGMLFLGIYFSFKKIKFNEIIDYLVTPLFVALGISKIGAFFAGTEVGTKTKFPIALKYVGFDGFRHLTPLYEGILFFLGAFISYKIMFAIRRDKYKKGFLFQFFFWYLALVYFLFDPIKSYHVMVLNQSFNRMVSLIILLTFSFYFLYYFRSLFTSGLGSFINLLSKYGKGTYKSVHKGSGKQVKTGEGQDSETDIPA